MGIAFYKNKSLNIGDFILMMKSTYFFTFTINNINRIVIPPKEKGFKSTLMKIKKL